MKLISSITIDVAKSYLPTIVKAKQYDNARYVQLTVTDNGLPFVIPDGTYAIFRGITPGGSFFYDATIDGNVIEVRLVEDVLSVAGKINAEINLYNTDEEKLTTFNFVIDVEAASIPDQRIIGTNYYTALTELVSKALATNTVIKIDGYADTVSALPTSGVEKGQMYGVGTSAPYDYYVWDGGQWINNGQLKGDPFTYDDFTEEQLANLVGPTGAAAGFGSPEIEANSLEPSSSPTASVDAYGPDSAKIFKFSFGIPKGVQGDTGTAAGFTDPEASATQLESDATPTVSVTASGEDTAKKFSFTFGIPKGVKGDKGDQGIQGDTGAAAGFGIPEAEITSLDSTANPTVTVEASGTNISKIFKFIFGIPKGVKGDKGDQGIQGDTGTAAGFGTPEIEANSLEPSASPTASVEASGSDTAKIFKFAFGIPKGAKGDKGDTGAGFAVLGYFDNLSALQSSVLDPSPGDAYGIGTSKPYDIYLWDERNSKWVDNGQLQGAKGDTGTAAGFTDPEASATQLESDATPTVSVTASGEDTAKKFSFTFGIPKGVKGDKGDQGIQGDTGAAAGFTDPEASATQLDADATPTASVTASGEDTAKKFSFIFGIPKGVKGDKGDQGVQGDTGTAAGFTDPEASATQLESDATPTVSVTASGEDTAKKFSFIFGIPKGVKGDKGDQGIQGDTGAAAGFTDPEASATQLESDATPTVSVTTSGEDTAKKISFAFGIPKGVKGDKGDTGPYFTPAISSAGVISWTNNGGLDNPESVDLAAAVIAALPSADSTSY